VDIFVESLDSGSETAGINLVVEDEARFRGPQSAVSACFRRGIPQRRVSEADEPGDIAIE